DADIAEIDLDLSVLRRVRRQDVVLVGEANALAVAAEDVNMRAAAEGAWRERWDQITGVQRQAGLRVGLLDTNPLPLGRAVLPVRCRVFWAVDEYDLAPLWMVGGDAAASTVARLI